MDEEFDGWDPEWDWLDPDVNPDLEPEDDLSSDQSSRISITELGCFVVAMLGLGLAVVLELMGVF